MNSELVIQLSVSMIASVCYGLGFLMWLISIGAFGLRTVAAKPLISSQVIIGTIAFLGLIISSLLVFMEANSAKGTLLRSRRLINLSNIDIRDVLAGNSVWN